MRKKIRPIRPTFENVEKKKKVLDALRESINESKIDIDTNTYFFQTGLNMGTEGKSLG